MFLCGGGSGATRTKSSGWDVYSLLRLIIQSCVLEYRHFPVEDDRPLIFLFKLDKASCRKISKNPAATTPRFAHVQSYQGFIYSVVFWLTSQALIPEALVFRRRSH